MNDTSSSDVTDCLESDVYLSYCFISGRLVGGSFTVLSCFGGVS